MKNKFILLIITLVFLSSCSDAPNENPMIEELWTRTLIHDMDGEVHYRMKIGSKGLKVALFSQGVYKVRSSEDQRGFQGESPLKSFKYSFTLQANDPEKKALCPLSWDQIEFSEMKQDVDPVSLPTFEAASTTF